MKLRDKMKINRIKKTAVKLALMRQITDYHANLILHCDFNDEKYVKFLMWLSEKFMRVRGYYKNAYDIQHANSKLCEYIQRYKRGDKIGGNCSN